jgi:hypothetical protein
LDYIFFELLAQAEKPKLAETSAIAETPAIFKFRIEIYKKKPLKLVGVGLTWAQ